MGSKGAGKSGPGTKSRGNPKGKYGKTLKCHICGSESHLRRECPKAQTKIEHPVSGGPGTNLKPAPDPNMPVADFESELARLMHENMAQTNVHGSLSSPAVVVFFTRSVKKKASKQELELSNVCSVPVPVSPSNSYPEVATGDFVASAWTADESVAAAILPPHTPVGEAENVSIAATLGITDSDDPKDSIEKMSFEDSSDSIENLLQQISVRHLPEFCKIRFERTLAQLPIRRL